MIRLNDMTYDLDSVDWSVKLQHKSESLALTLFFFCVCMHACVCFCVCVEVLWPSQPNGVMSSTVSLPNHTFTGKA